ncbi:alcohol oxidase [Pholiota conissans]|uniref:pyranose dehydrogenase (acceptor) n=1 Tax=Pholiota conissans TaxID=109636 RepID=A0A9P6CWH5_9AGAR|nr:alcohol oxidase [Pholiota conissans]
MAATIDQVSSKKFDYIVIGGGTAGLALASRLTEDVNTSVLVLEAGPANLNDPMLLTPGMLGVHFKNPQYDWAFETVPQKELDGRAVFWARGKTLGGSSAINFFQFHHPPKRDIDAFERLGNPGWNWDLLKKYYDKSSGFIPPGVKRDEISYNSDQRNTYGPVKYAYSMHPSGFEGPYQRVLKSIGIPVVKDPLLGDIKGTWITPLTIDPETKGRTYAANMYYIPNADRKNFTVLVNAQVAKIDLQKVNGVATATGVQFIYEGKLHTALASKEVILSAGSIMSPQILELSGIGSNKVLDNAGVETIIDLPGVGENIQEHIYSGTTFEVKKDIQDQFTTFDCLRDPAELEKQKVLFSTEGKGALAMAPTVMSFLPLSTVSPDAETLHQDLKKTINEGITTGRYSPALQKQFKLQLENIDGGHPNTEMVLVQGFVTPPIVAGPEPGKKYVTMSCFLNHPFSRGTIHIGSNNFLDSPAIDPHYFEEKHDLRVFIELVKFNRRVMQMEPLNSFFNAEVNPGFDHNSDKKIGDYLKKSFSTTFHTVGSCSMRPLEDGGVVSPQLKVYGTSNLRVVDISIIPLHIGSHPQSTAYAIGELAADIIEGKTLQT